MSNPYIAALVRSTERTRELAPPAPEMRELSSGLSRFFDALAIGHPGNRAKVATAVASTLLTADLEEGIARLEKDTAETIATYVKLNAPACIMENARKTNDRALGILRRRLAQRVR